MNCIVIYRIYLFQGSFYRWMSRNLILISAMLPYRSSLRFCFGFVKTQPFFFLLDQTQQSNIRSLNTIAAELTQSSLSLASSGGSGVDGAPTEHPPPDNAHDKSLVKDELIKPVCTASSDISESEKAFHIFLRFLPAHSFHPMFYSCFHLQSHPVIPDSLVT